MNRVCLLTAVLSVSLAAVAGEPASKDAAPAAARLTDAKTADGKSYISWKEHRIDDSALGKVGLVGADGLRIADLDRDGRMDVVAVHENCGNHVRVSFGTKDPDKWESYTLSPGPSEGRDSVTLVGGAEDVVIGDVNGDGRLDVVACGESGGVVYFEAPADPRKMADWKRVQIARKSAEEKSRWIRVDLGDLDGDGKIEILGAHKGGTDWVCFRREGAASDPGAWKRLVIGKTRMPINIRAVDIDKDGDLDVLGGSRGESKIVLFENLGNDKKWEEKWRAITLLEGKITLPTPPSLTIGGTAVPVSGASKWGSSGFMVDFADLDRDGRLDIVTETKHSGGLFWMKQPENLDAAWPRYYIGHIIPDDATGLELADINGDGRLDLFTGGYSYTARRANPETIAKPGAKCGRLAWFEAPADPTKPWKRHDVSRRAQGMYDMFFAHDLNGDGLIDFIATRGNSSPLDGAIWLEQVRSEKPAPVFTSAWPPKEESRQQPFPQDGK